LPFLHNPSPTDHINGFTERVVTLAFGEVLLLFLRSLRTPVVPYSLFPLVSRAVSSGDTFEFLDALPPVSANVWISVTSYLQFVCVQPYPSLVPRFEAIASIFSPVLLRDPEPLATPPILTPSQKRRFLSYFLT